MRGSQNKRPDPTAPTLEFTGMCFPNKGTILLLEGDGKGSSSSSTCDDSKEATVVLH